MFIKKIFLRLALKRYVNFSETIHKYFKFKLTKRSTVNKNFMTFITIS